MKNIISSFCACTLILPLFSGIGFGMSDIPADDFPKTILEKTEKQIQNFENNSDENFDSWEWRRLQSALETQQMGGLNIFSGMNNVVDGLDILTGKSSMNDSMQLGDFSSGLENKEQFLENIKESLNNYWNNSEEKIFPQSLEDFKKYEGERWAEIQMGNSWDSPRKNISEIIDLVDYKRIKEESECSSEEIDALEDTLEDTPKYECKNIEYDFTLSLKPQKFDINISEVQSIETKSHDFDELLKELENNDRDTVHRVSTEEKIPEIYSLIPADTFSVYFSDPQKYKEFSETLSNPVSEIAQILPLPTVNKIEKMIGDRLGIGDPKKFLGAVTEFAFVGADIRLYPNSDFALIFKCKSDLACKIFGSEKITGKNGKEFFVLATHERFLEKIKQTTVGNAYMRSLQEEKDFIYSWKVTEQRRDGFIFFSDAFIRKMVSPEYRINLRRQESVVETMNALQYPVWIYKKNEGKFPENFQELVEKKYIAENSVYDLKKYSIDEKGIVHHEIWGTPFEITPVTRVDLEKISAGEKNWYETGVDQYQSNYQEFFDPIGVSITVADKILFHTVILPLSENDEYQMLKTIGGNISKEYFELPGKYPTAAEGIIGFDMDEILYEIGKEMGSMKESSEDSVRISDIMSIRNAVNMYYADEGRYPDSFKEKELDIYFFELPTDPSGEEYEYKAFEKFGVENECFRITARLSEVSKERMENDEGIDPNLFELGICDDLWKENFSLSDKKPRRNQIINEPTKLEIIQNIEAEMLDELEINWEGRLFDFMGDELMIGFGEEMKFDFDSYDTEGLDIFLALRLKDKEKAEKFFLMIVKKIADEMRGGGGFFRINKPIKNHWGEGEKKKEYYSLPLGFVNIFVFFDEDVVSFTVSQNTIHNMIEGTSAVSKKKSKSQNNGFTRLHTFLEGEKNILLTADTQKIIQWFDLIPEEMIQEMEAEFAEDVIETLAQKSYIAELSLLEKIVGEKFISENFLYRPEIFGMSPSYQEKNIIWKKDGKTVDIEEEIQKISVLERVKECIAAYGETGLSFAFTEHGAEIKIAFDNAANTEQDERFESHIIENSTENIPFKNIINASSATIDALKNISTETILFILAGLGGLALIGRLIFIARKNNA